MDKNNDIKVNKISKWDAAPKNMGTLFTYIELVIGMACSLPPEIHDNLYDLMDKTLDEYNELEAKYQESCGMISQYEEEKDDKDKLIDELNSKIKELKLRTNMMYGCYGLNTSGEPIRKIQRLEKEKIDLEVRLAQSDDLRYRSAKYAWAIKTILKKATFSPGHIAEELRFMARESTTPKDVTERWEGYADELLGEHSKLVDKINQLEKKNDDLKKENNNLTTDTKRLSDAVEAWFNMFNDMRRKRDFLKKEYEKLKETNKSCPVACECENFKPKVHRSYDPLDDLPDVEHS